MTDSAPSPTSHHGSGPISYDLFPEGTVIPAHPLAVTSAGNLDEEGQNALTDYYLRSGVTGLAVGVHTTQFALHEDQTLLRHVWQMAAEPSRNAGVTLVAGVMGDTAQAVSEAQVARSLGYEAVLLAGVGADQDESRLLERAIHVGKVLPVVGFYLQEAVGGRYLSPAFWGRFFDIESVVGIKTAPFDRYRTHEAAQALLESDRWAQIALLTGNDDTIVPDLVTPVRREVSGTTREAWFRGGLLGQWAVGTRAAAQLVAAIIRTRRVGVAAEVLAAHSALVEVNAALFDVRNNFAGCVAGVNECLRQQGLIGTARSLGDLEILSEGQAELIRDVRQRFPDLLDEPSGQAAGQAAGWVATAG
ncbi:dihydrodipicolinate synthase family protein [Ornithinimicrobium cavernae]|uniref:dihydrodipicolinate synthase family protein n=1 Tax=Ornithinimicrobium cavernae TaxID=2666047 RepID=UPI000D69C4C7|nr:dihydrodipicolinate synthase family protein [Ornithinimicrobium cavernae]